MSNGFRYPRPGSVRSRAGRRLEPDRHRRRLGRELIPLSAEGLLHHDAVGPRVHHSAEDRPGAGSVTVTISGEVDGQTVTTDKFVDYPATTR